jgi:DNA-binding transcriptional ArsR family regulator
LVHSRKEGLKVIYALSDTRTYEVIDLLSEVIRQIWHEKAELVR